MARKRQSIGIVEEDLKSKRPAFPSSIGWGGSLTIASWFIQKEQSVVLADFGRLQRSGGL